MVGSSLPTVSIRKLLLAHSFAMLAPSLCSLVRRARSFAGNNLLVNKNRTRSPTMK